MGQDSDGNRHKKDNAANQQIKNHDARNTVIVLGRKKIAETVAETWDHKRTKIYTICHSGTHKIETPSRYKVGMAYPDITLFKTARGRHFFYWRRQPDSNW